MKKIILIISYILIFFNPNVSSSEKENLLKIGLLAPLSGEYKELGTSLLYSLQLALFDIGWADSMQHAKNKILSGKVFVNGFRTKNNKAKLNVLDIVRCESNVEVKKHQYKTASATRFVIDSLTLTAIFVGKF